MILSTDSTFYVVCNTHRSVSVDCSQHSVPILTGFYFRFKIYFLFCLPELSGCYTSCSIFNKFLD